MFLNLNNLLKFLLISFLISLISIYNTYGQNLLKTIAIQYKVRSKNPNDDLDFRKFIAYNKLDKHEVIVGVERATIQPYAYIQNISDKQLAFKSVFRIFNNDKNRLIYNIKAPVSAKCLSLHDTASADCNGNPFIRVRYCSVVQNIDGLEVKYLPFPGNENLTGIPPNGFVEIQFTPFVPNDFYDNHFGNCTASLIIDPTIPESELPIGESIFSDDTLKFNLLLRKPMCAELFYPEDGDTIDCNKNYFYGLSNFNKNVNYKLEFSKQSDFNVIDTTINNLTAQDFKLEPNSVYYWRLKTITSDSTCISTVNSFKTGNPTGVFESSNIRSIYPNPATDYINIHPSEGFNILIFNTLCEIMMSVEQTSPSVQRIDISNLSPGIYFIKIGNRVEEFVKM
jgi:hypothetical protein